MYLKETGSGVCLIQDRDHCWVYVKMLMTFGLPYKDKNFMTN
jgi:ATP-dependent Clp protease adapter protein ClpS